MAEHTVSLVTGANAGMGRVIATGLARRGGTVVILCRDATRGEQTRAAIARDTGNHAIELLVADLALHASVRAAAQQFRERHGSLHILVNNAGAHIQEYRRSPDGLELNLAINHLGPFLLTQLLLDPLRAAAVARIVNVASASMARVLDLDDLQSERTFAPMAAYGRAKLAMVLCTYALARRLADTNVAVNALHPGIVATTIVDDVAPPLARPFLGLIKHFLLTPEQGAQTALYLAKSPAVAGLSGQYFARGKARRSVPISYDERLQEQVWALSSRLTGLSA